MFINLITMLSLAVFAGDSSGNGGNVYEGHIQRISAKRLLPALDHEKNAGRFDELEKKGIQSLLSSKVPFKVVKPDRLEKERYYELDGNEAKDFSPEGTRIIKDRTTRRLIIQWDEANVKETTLNGTVFDDAFIRKVFKKSLNYAYATGGIEIDDKAAAQLAGKLYVPTSSENVTLPSSDYRYEIHRRVKELIALQQRNIALAQKKGRPRTILVDYEAKVTNLRQLLTYRFENADEEMASNLDLTERILRQDYDDMNGRD